MATKEITITDDRQGRSFRTGINGRQFDLPVGQKIKVEEAVYDHLKGLGVALDEDGASKRANSSQEGSGDELAPIGEHDVRAPGTDAKSLGDRPLAGDQPGDVTASGGVSYGTIGGQTIEEAARISDIRVAAERSVEKDAPVAARAGEGELGTDTVKPAQGVKPTHKDEAPASSSRGNKKAGKETAATVKKASPDGAGRP